MVDCSRASYRRLNLRYVGLHLGPEAEGHGTDAMIRAFHRGGGTIRARVPLIKAIASIITIGTGGSAGQEGPIASCKDLARGLREP